MSKEFRIEVTGTHTESDLRPWGVICNALLTALKPAGFTVATREFEFECHIVHIELVAHQLKSVFDHVVGQ